MRGKLLILGMTALAGGLALAAPQIQEVPVPQQPARDTIGAPAVGTAGLGGRVTTDDSAARPIRRATITLGGAPIRTPRYVLTDDEGRFVFTALPPGSYTLSAAKAPYLTTAYGARRAGKPGTPIALVAGQQLTTLALKMPAGAVIAGTITDQVGRPAANARIQLYELRTISGERTLTPASGAPGGGIITDDRGAYRLYGIAPGEYAVVAWFFSQGDVRLIADAEILWAEQQLQQAARSGGTPPQPGAKPSTPAPGPTVGYSTVYYPGTADAASAGTVTVGVGEVRLGVNFSLLLVPTAKIDGVVLTPEGLPAASVPITLAPQVRGILSGASAGRSTDRDGKFSFPGVTPGTYALTVRSAPGRGGGPPPPPAPGGGGGVRLAPGPTGMSLWALADVDVNGQDVSGVTLTLQPGMTVSGRVVFESASQAPPQDLLRVRISLVPAPGGSGVSMAVPASQLLKPDSTFVIDGVTPSRYRIGANAPPTPGATTAWALKSAVLNGKDTLDSFFEVKPNENVSDMVLTFTDRLTELSGSLLDAGGRPAVGYLMIVFSTDKGMWTQGSRRTRRVTPNTAGQFVVGNLPPGEYYMAAVTDVDPADLYDATFLSQVAGSSYKITLAEGEKKSQDLKLAGSYSKA